MALADRIATRLGFERRDRTAYAEAELAKRQAEAMGTGRHRVRELAATEIAAGLWSRALARAKVAPDTAAAILTPAVLGMVGRALFQRGEFAARLMVQRGRLVAVPCTVANVSGNSTDPLDWSYLLDVPTPAGSQSQG